MKMFNKNKAAIDKYPYILLITLNLILLKKNKDKNRQIIP